MVSDPEDSDTEDDFCKEFENEICTDDETETESTEYVTIDQAYADLLDAALCRWNSKEITRSDVHNLLRQMQSCIPNELDDIIYIAKKITQALWDNIPYYSPDKLHGEFMCIEHYRTLCLGIYDDMKSAHRRETVSVPVFAISQYIRHLCVAKIRMLYKEKMKQCRRFQDILSRC